MCAASLLPVLMPLLVWRTRLIIWLLLCNDYCTQLLTGRQPLLAHAKKYNRKAPLQRIGSAYFLCTFDIEQSPGVIYHDNKTAIYEKPPPPRMIWSHFPNLPAVDSIPQLRYATPLIVAIDNARINLVAGTIYNADGCISNHSFSTQDWPQRQVYMRRQAAPPATSSTHYDFEEAIYLWGSLFANDWQHAVIDLLPLLNLALPLLRDKPNIPVIAGKYVHFFKDVYPFSELLSNRHKPRNYQQAGTGGSKSVALTAIRRLYVVDLIHRQQSYLIPGAYDRILPFLQLPVSELGGTHSLSPQNSDRWIRQLTYNLTETARQKAPLQKPRLVVYLDRNSLAQNASYRTSVGKINGRGVTNQLEVLEAIEKALVPPYRLQVWQCVDWRQDREVLSQAAVVMGPHGGHFTNMLFAPQGAHIIEFGRAATLRQQRFTMTMSRDGPLVKPGGGGATKISKNARWVYSGMSAALGHHHWFVEDISATATKADKSGKSLSWSDEDMLVDVRQVVDTLKAIGVA